MLAESLLIAVACGRVGLLGSVWGIELLRVGFNFNDLGRRLASGFGLDPPTLLFTLAVSLLTALLFGLLPAIRASRANPRNALSESGRTGSTGFHRNRLRSMLVIAEIALAFVLLACAGVLMREVIRDGWKESGRCRTWPLITWAAIC